MIFEEALKQLRNGKKIRHTSFENDEYLMACYIALTTVIDDDGKELIDSFDDAKKHGMSIIRMKGDEQHIDMFPSEKLSFKEYCDLLDKYPFLQEKFIYPTINLLLIMSDDWEIWE